jgi:DNA-binding NarL/FixJ family response regulator
MSLEMGISIIASLFGVGSLAFSWFCYNNSRNHRQLLEFLAKQNEELEESLAAGKETFENGSKRFSEQSRRIAWLETRVRQPKLATEEVVDERVSAGLPKSNMTERRHRVLTLASRGQNSDKIAATLGMMRGEVELILNLNRVAV